jgi:hypothetical protein
VASSDSVTCPSAERLVFETEIEIHHFSALEDKLFSTGLLRYLSKPVDNMKGIK